MLPNDRSAIDPTGAFLYAANQNPGTVVPFAIDSATGQLTPTVAPITADRPQFVGVFGFQLAQGVVR
jgi:6-phosphogluconolactonase (cycloisomerase 2 family)